MGWRVLLDPRLGEQAREEEAELAMSFFAPGGDIDNAETVSLVSSRSHQSEPL